MAGWRHILVDIRGADQDRFRTGTFRQYIEAGRSLNPTDSCLGELAGNGVAIANGCSVLAR